MSKEFELYLYRANNADFYFTTEVSLPASDYELKDALDRARSDIRGTGLMTELFNTKRDYLYDRLPENVNLFELNYLARRLASLDEHESACFEGLVMMDSVKNANRRIPIETLINMTYSIADCQAILNVQDDRALGRFYDENGFLKETENLSDEVLELIDFEAVGRRARMQEGGVFTPKGYVVSFGKLSAKYKIAMAAQLNQPESTLILRMARYDFEGFESQPSVQMMLPASESEIANVLEAVGAASLAETVVEVQDCAVPFMAPHVEESFHDAHDVGVLNSFAVCMAGMISSGQMLKYKAVLDTLRCTDIEEACKLALDLNHYRFNDQITSPYVYAVKRLTEQFPKMPPDSLSRSVDLLGFGEMLLAHENAQLAQYGLVQRQDGAPILTPPETGMIQQI